MTTYDDELMTTSDDKFFLPPLAPSQVSLHILEHEQSVSEGSDASAILLAIF